MRGDKVIFDKNLRISTERLVIRPFTEDDCEAMLEIQSNPEMTKYTPDEPWKSIEDAQKFVKMVLWLYDLENNIFSHFFAIVKKESNKLIGYCGIGGIEYDRTQNEVFYGIHQGYWGNGYATEVGRAMLKYGFVTLGLDRIIGAVHTENAGSINVLEKIGLSRVGLISGLAEEFNGFNGEYLYEMKRDEYLQLCTVRDKGTGLLTPQP